MALRKVEIELQVPFSVGNRELAEYVEQAVYCWGSQRHPDDHLCGTIEVNFVLVAKIKRAAAAKAVQAPIAKKGRR